MGEQHRRRSDQRGPIGGGLDGIDRIAGQRGQRSIARRQRAIIAAAKPQDMAIISGRHAIKKLLAIARTDFHDAQARRFRGCSARGAHGMNGQRGKRLQTGSGQPHRLRARDKQRVETRGIGQGPVDRARGEQRHAARIEPCLLYTSRCV